MSSYKTLRIKVKEFYNNSCAICGIKDWQGKYLTLQVDHIDGNNKNNDFNNLRPLCPNCHSQTDTYTFKKTQSVFFNKLNDYLKNKSKKEIQQFFNQYCFDEICILTGTSLRSIRKYLKNNSNITPKWKIQRDKKFEINKKNLYQLLVVNKIPVSKVAKKYNVSHAAIRKRAKNFGIKIPKYWSLK